jgi:hypothetical protein
MSKGEPFVNFKRTLALVASTSLAFGLAGCGKGMTPAGVGMTSANPYAAAAAARRATQKGGKWNILIHMSAENNLYSFGLEDVNEMEAGIPTDGSVNVFVLFDGVKNGDSCVYKIKHDVMNKEIISDKLTPAELIPASGEIDSGSADIAAKFVAWSVKAAPADHTFVGYWDHGSGLFNGNPNPITKGFGWDDNGTHMTTADISKITSAFKAASGGKNLSGLGFDACLMAHGEIAYQAAGTTDYLVASEELEPGKGWDYKGWLEAVGKSNHTPAAVMSALVDSYGASYAPGGSQASGRDNITLSATDINAFVSGTVPALNEFVAAANADMANSKAALQNARKNTQTFYNRDCGDLGSFISQMKAGGAKGTLGASLNKLQAAYAASVIRETHSKNYAGASGLVLYFPTPTQSINAAYADASKIAFAKESWKDLLKNYR